MPRFEPKTFSTFLERMSARVVARTALTDLNEGGNLHTLLAAVARELDDQSFQMTNLQRIWDIDTATGEDLDERGLDLNPTKLERTAASKASGSVVFSRTGTSGTISIPQGTVVNVPGGGPEFETTAAGSILDTFSSSAAIPVLALEAGVEGNVDASTVTQFNGVTGAETVTNAAAFTGGQDEESDEQFRERIKTFLRSLPRGTPDALKFAVLNTFLDDFGRIVTAEVVELPAPDLGIVYIYVDDGAGTVSIVLDNIGAPETVVASAIGGEVRVNLANVPVVFGSSVAVELNAVPITEGVDYVLNRATGQITFAVALSPGDAVTAEYQWQGGLIAEAQKIVDGDPGDRVNYPGYRAAGTQVFVRPPTILQQLVVGALVIDGDFLGLQTEIREDVSSAINRYINNLPINGDVIVSELIFAAQSVEGVVDVTFTTPASNVIIGEGQLARTSAANITIT